MSVAILIPAAGAARRMRGRDKLLEPVDGEALLRRQARAARSAAAEVLVTLPAGDASRRAALDGLDLRIVEVSDASEGMAASLRAGAAALSPAAGGVMVLPADMPDLTVADLDRMIAAFAADPAPGILRATGADGTPGHPVIFARRFMPAFADLTGDGGARAILDRHAAQLRYLPLPGRHAVTDLDTPEAWSAWRARR